MNPGKDKILETTNKTRDIVPLHYLVANESMFVLVMYLALYVNKKYQVKYMHKRQPRGQLL